MAVESALRPLDPAGYVPHELHGPDRVFSESNCTIDLWIETLHALGADPTMALGFAVGSAFDGDQWRMERIPAEDLRVLYGIELSELNVWRPISDHVEEQLGFGKLLALDVDAWFLPDTAGVTYRLEHQKTTIMARTIDRPARGLGYFHNAGYYELEDDDFDGLFGLGPQSGATSILPPFVEVVHLDRLCLPGHEGPQTVLGLTRDHLSRRPQLNPVEEMGRRVESDVEWLVAHDLDTYHRYAFGTFRQCGAMAELAASLLDWLTNHGVGYLDGSTALWRELAVSMKALEFTVARLVRGRDYDIHRAFGEAAALWADATESLVSELG